MNLKESSFLIYGIILCVFGISLLIYGYGIYKKEALRFNILTFLIFMEIAPEFKLDFSLLPYYFAFSYYPIEIFFNIYILLLEFIQNTLQPYIISVFYPIVGVVFITIGSIFITLGIIYFRQQYSNIQ